MYIEDACRCWKILKEHFSQGNSMRVAELHVELYHLKQGNLSAIDFFTHLSMIWEEIQTYRPAPECKCLVKCKCDVINDTLKYKEDDCVIRFVTSLNENFAMVRTQILMMEPLPSLNRAFSMVVQFEKQSGLCIEGEESHVLINAADSRRQPSYGRGRGCNAKVCTYCGKTGHTVETCYKKHGFLPGFQKWKGGNASVNASDNTEDSNDRFEDAASMKQSPTTSLTHEEYKALMSLLKSTSSKAIESTQSAPESHSVNHARSVLQSNNTYKGSYAGFEEEDDWFG